MFSVRKRRAQVHGGKRPDPPGLGLRRTLKLYKEEPRRDVVACQPDAQAVRLNDVASTHLAVFHRLKIEQGILIDFPKTDSHHCGTLVNLPGVTCIGKRRRLAGHIGHDESRDRDYRRLAAHRAQATAIDKFDANIIADPMVHLTAARVDEFVRRARAVNRPDQPLPEHHTCRTRIEFQPDNRAAIDPDPNAQCGFKAAAPGKRQKERAGKLPVGGKGLLGEAGTGKE